MPRSSELFNPRVAGVSHLQHNDNADCGVNVERDTNTLQTQISIYAKFVLKVSNKQQNPALMSGKCENWRINSLIIVEQGQSESRGSSTEEEKR